MASEKEWINNADISWIDPERPVVALCYDDGPYGTDESLPAVRIQNAFRENGFHATFFYTANLFGEELTEDKKAEIIRAEKLGFEVANHTMTHPDLTSLTAEEMIREITGCSNILSGLTGKNDFLIRPPYLNVNDVLMKNAHAPLITCTLDTFDWNGTDSDTMTAMLESRISDGSLRDAVVLMHETYEATAETTERILSVFKKNGWQAVSVSELYKLKNIPLVRGQLYGTLVNKK